MSRPGDARPIARLMPALARLLPLVALACLPACDEAASPEGSPSNFDVYVYLELDETAGMSGVDEPVRATVTVASNSDDMVRVDSTGSDGHVSFEDMPSGGYTVSHVATALRADLELRGSAVQTVMAPFGGGVVETRFIYGFAPGVLTGVAYRDDNESGSFESGLDSVFAAVPVLVYAGPDTTGTPAAAGQSGADGRFELPDLEPGEHTLLVRPRIGTAVVGGNPRPITIAAGDTTFHPIEFVGEPLGALMVQEARETPARVPRSQSPRLRPFRYRIGIRAEILAMRLVE